MKAVENDEFFDGFAWALPKAFAAPLAACRFEQGDILYDTTKAYEGEWGIARSHIGHSIEIQSPMRGGGIKSDEDQKSVFASNWSSRVEFTLRDYRTETERHVTTTQGRLYWLLWKGNIESFEVETVRLPASASELLGQLAETAEFVCHRVPHKNRAGGVFLIPFDIAEQRFWIKARSVRDALQDFNVLSGIIGLAEAGIQNVDTFAPTARIAWFGFADKVKPEEIEQALKTKLHKPSKNKKTDKEVFHMHRHGHLFA